MRGVRRVREEVAVGTVTVLVEEVKEELVAEEPLDSCHHQRWRARHWCHPDTSFPAPVCRIAEAQHTGLSWRSCRVALWSL